MHQESAVSNALLLNGLTNLRRAAVALEGLLDVVALEALERLEVRVREDLAQRGRRRAVAARGAERAQLRAEQGQRSGLGTDS